MPKSKSILILFVPFRIQQVVRNHNWSWVCLCNYTQEKKKRFMGKCACLFLSFTLKSLIIYKKTWKHLWGVTCKFAQVLLSQSPYNEVLYNLQVPLVKQICFFLCIVSFWLQYTVKWYTCHVNVKPLIPLHNISIHMFILFTSHSETVCSFLSTSVSSTKSMKLLYRQPFKESLRLKGWREINTITLNELVTIRFTSLEDVQQKEDQLFATRSDYDVISREFDAIV